MVGKGRSEGAMAGGGGTMPQQEESGRVRAWVLAKAENPAEAAERIWNEEVGVDKSMIVRADVVSGAQPKNILVPVDAANPDELEAAKAIITKKTGDNALTVARVTKHKPYPPGDGRNPWQDEDQDEDEILGKNPWG